MPIRIDFVGTESFYNNWRPKPADKAQSIRDYCETIWRNSIGNKLSQKSSFEYRDRHDVEVKNSAFQTQTVGIRLANQWRWLNNNWAKCSSSDGIVVIDYCQDPVLGDSVQASAGSAKSYIAMVNTKPEDSNPANLDPFSGSESVAQHELCHLFGADHPDHVSLNEDSEASLMYSPRESHPFGCNKPSGYTSPPSNLSVGHWHSSCTKNRVLSYINSHYP